MATIHLPRSLIALFPALPRRLEVEAVDVAGAIASLDRLAPGVQDRLVETGPAIREHINIFVDGERASLATALGPASVMHIIPAVSGGATDDRADSIAAPRTPLRGGAYHRQR